MCQVASFTITRAPNSKVTFCNPANMGANLTQGLHTPKTRWLLLLKCHPIAKMYRTFTFSEISCYEEIHSPDPCFYRSWLLCVEASVGQTGETERQKGRTSPYWDESQPVQ